MKNLIAVILALAAAIPASAQKLETYPATTTPASTDLLMMGVDVSGTFRTRKITLQNFGTRVGALGILEPHLGNPGTSGFVLSSTTGGVRSWIAQAAAFGNQSANLIFAGPGSGGAAAPSFRAMVEADLPAGSFIDLVDPGADAVLMWQDSDSTVRTAGFAPSAVTTLTGTQTLTNKRHTPRVVSVAYAASVTPNADTTDVLKIGALTGPLTLANPSGTPVEGQTLRIRIPQDGTGNRAITLGNKYRIPTSATSPLAFSTAASAEDKLAVEYDAADDKWDVVQMVPGY